MITATCRLVLLAVRLRERQRFVGDRLRLPVAALVEHEVHAARRTP